MLSSSKSPRQIPGLDPMGWYPAFPPKEIIVTRNHGHLSPYGPGMSDGGGSAASADCSSEAPAAAPPPLPREVGSPSLS